MQRRILTILVTLFLLASACGNDSDSDLAEQPGSQDTSDCDGLANRWSDIQQEYLDRLGDASAEEVTEVSTRVASAGQWLGGVLLEHARDASAVGCEAEMVAGTPLLCARVDALEAAGEAGADAIDTLQAGCPQP